MEGSLGHYKDNPLTRVTLTFIPEEFKSDLQNYLKFVTKSTTVKELNSNLLKASQKLTFLDAFDKGTFLVNPGEGVNMANVVFRLQPKKKLEPQFEMESDPWVLSVNTQMRNLFGSINLLKLKMGLDLQYKNKTFVLSYLNKLGFINRLQYGFELRKDYRYLDLNIDENVYSLFAFIQTYSKRHFGSLGYALRSNQIYTDNSSVELINEGLLPTSKYFLNYIYNRDHLTPLRFNFTSKSQIGFNDKIEFLKLEKEISKSVSLPSALRLFGSLKIGKIFALQTDRVGINDRLRFGNLKGFRFIGKRLQASDQVLGNNLEVSGDHLGSNLVLSSEVSLSHESFPIFYRFGIKPFIFASSAYVHESDDYKQNIRSAVGFGAKINLKFGSLEIVYSSKVWARPGDSPAEIQVFLNN